MIEKRDEKTKRKLLMTASTFSHIHNFHIPYLNGFRELGWEIDVACGGDPRDIPGADRLIPLPLKKNIAAPENLRAALILRKEMMRNRYDLVISHTSLASFFTRLALLSVAHDLRSINVVHGYLFDDDSNCIKRAVYTVAEYFVSSVTDEILTMNRYDYEWAKKHFPCKRIQNIPGMGVDEARIAAAQKYDFGFPKGSVVLIFPAEFSKRKNQAMLIRAMVRLPEHVKLVLPGDGVLLAECKTLAEDLGVAHRVRFPGYENDPIPLFKGADIAVSSSRFEGLPFNLIEAMQCGLPIVAPRVKGNEDLVQEVVNGLLYAYNDVDDYVQAVNSLTTDEILRQKMGKAGQVMALQYELSAVYPQVMDAYNWN